jgi:hypothetical protein
MSTLLLYKQKFMAWNIRATTLPKNKLCKKYGQVPTSTVDRIAGIPLSTNTRFIYFQNNEAYLFVVIFHTTNFILAAMNNLHLDVR